MKVPVPFQYVLYGLAIVIGTLLLFLMAEGAASIAHSVHTSYIHTNRLISQQYDADLGWSGLPNIHLENVFGSGSHLTRNSKGFRMLYEPETSVPDGRIRILCSGDSFTFGYGVNDTQTWCHTLSTIDPDVESIVLAEGGYGLDQALLKYERDGEDLEHHVHLLAFPAIDIDRMRYTRFFRYEKPQFIVEDGKLTVTNVPVPKSDAHSLVAVPLKALLNLHSVDLLSRWMRPTERKLPGALEEEHVQEILRHMFDRMLSFQKQHDALQVLVFLPTRKDIAYGASNTWRSFVEEEAAKRNLAFVDLVPAIQALERHTAERMFLPVNTVPDPTAGKHYSVEGNALIANLLSQALQDIDGYPR